ncbi:MAG TPA: helix-turn-helix domain-containing protein [Thermotogota bacterium]|nr:helix-turn-helix domain-containing protein [Thermotogota bacterium]HOS25823.1 helix-turn-helix domain-containing protein [Thermotogota bacterium]HPL39935.1 helix-turn-helix domain-containing protein [Thermotogota bacterium]
MDTLPNEFMTFGEAAELLRVSYRTVQRWVRLGNLKGYKITAGRNVRVKRAEVLALLKETAPKGEDKE